MLPSVLRLTTLNVKGEKNVSSTVAFELKGDTDPDSESDCSHASPQTSLVALGSVVCFLIQINVARHKIFRIPPTFQHLAEAKI